MDGKIDGKFVIQRKDGITQGIANELGLSAQECKQISGSIWTQVIQEFNDSNNMQVQNNNGINPNAENNFMVHENAIVTFSKECWKRIVDLINNALDKNIQVGEAEETTQRDLLADKNNDFSAKNEQNLQSAYNELKSMTGLLVQKYNLDETKYLNSLDTQFKEHLKDLPKTIVDTADLAMSILQNVFEELMTENKKGAIENALIEVAQHWKDVEGANIGGMSCREIIESGEKIQEMTNIRLGASNDYVETARESINDLINNFDKITLPKEVNRQEFFEKLKNYNPENIENLGGHYRFGLKLNENPSKADIAISIISDILGMNDAKENREIKSEIILRQSAVDNVMKMYDDDMTLRGTKFSEVRNRAEQHQNAINEARDYIKSNFKNSGLDKQVDENVFLACLNSITLDIESNGSGRVEDGVLAIETNDTDTTDYIQEGTGKTRMVKLLIHEAYHLYLEKTGQHVNPATKEEEATAEMLALRAMANLCNSDSSLKPFEIYGHSIEDYTSNDVVASNPKFVSEFLSGYTGHTGTVEEAIKKAENNIKL